MISFQNNYTFSGKNEYFDFVIHSYLGDREEQQDTSGYFISDNCGAFVTEWAATGAESLREK